MPKNKKALRAKSRRNIIKGLISNPSVGINVERLSSETLSAVHGLRGCVAAKNEIQRRSITDTPESPLIKAGQRAALIAKRDSAKINKIFATVGSSPKKRRVNKNSYR